jgi:hypothetical protein
MSNIQKWEYCYDSYYIYGGCNFEDHLKGYGDQGWELIFIHFHIDVTSYNNDYYKLIFKRPIIENNG